MAKRTIAKLFQNGRNQAVRLPREFRFQGDCVWIRRVSSGVLVEPTYSDVDEWFSAMDQFGPEPFPERIQPPTPEPDVFD